MSVDSNFRHVPQFDGDPNKFQVFWVRFQGHATACGCEDALDDKPEADLPATKKTVINPSTA